MVTRLHSFGQWHIQVTCHLQRRALTWWYQGSRGGGAIWKQNMETRCDSMHCFPWLNPTSHSALSSSDESIHEVGTLIIQSPLSRSNTKNQASNTWVCGNISYPYHAKNFFLLPSVSEGSISVPSKPATPLSRWLTSSLAFSLFLCPPSGSLLMFCQLHVELHEITSI